jgi:hypothetical protein
MVPSWSLPLHEKEGGRFDWSPPKLILRVLSSRSMSRAQRLMRFLLPNSRANCIAPCGVPWAAPWTALGEKPAERARTELASVAAGRPLTLMELRTRPVFPNSSLIVAATE